MSDFKKISTNISRLTIQNPKTNLSLEWMNVVNAGKKEIDYLKSHYQFNLDHLHASLSTVYSQRPMIHSEDKYLFMILHFPIVVNNRVTPGEIEFFIGHGYLITVHNNNIPALVNFFDHCKKDATSLLAYNQESSIILLYELLNKLINDCYVLIDNNIVALNEIEDLIYNQNQKEAVNKILSLRRNIINLRKILQNHEYILRKLTEVRSSLIPQEEIKAHYDRLVEHSKRIWGMLDNQQEMVGVLNDTNESLLNDKMTNIMKTLTIFSVIVFPLTLLAAIFGMNAKQMPLVDHPQGFWMIVGIMVLCSLGMLYFFEKKRWL